MADGIDVMSDTTGQKIVDALESNANNTKWVYFSNEELYNNYEKIEKDGVSISGFGGNSLYGTDFTANFTEGNIVVPDGEYGATSYYVFIPMVTDESAATSGVKISADNKILMLKLAVRNGAEEEKTFRIVNGGGVIVNCISLAAKERVNIEVDLTNNINADSVFYVAMQGNHIKNNQCYGISVCYKI